MCFFYWDFNSRKKMSIWKKKYSYQSKVRVCDASCFRVYSHESWLVLRANTTIALDAQFLLMGITIKGSYIGGLKLPRWYAQNGW